MDGATHDSEPRPAYVGLARSFDDVAEMYERARPTYPRQLFVDLADCVGPASGAGRVLEIGAGTGQATRGLLDRGWRVVALEPGPELARVARRVLAGLGDVEVVESPFEQWPADEEGSFDLVFAATSWHWLDPAVACRRAAELLHPGGTLAVVSTEHVLPELDGDPFFRQVEQAYEAVGMSDGQGAPVEPHSVADPEVVAIADSGLFEAPVVHRYVRERIYSAQEIWICWPRTPGTPPRLPITDNGCSPTSAASSRHVRMRPCASTT